MRGPTESPRDQLWEARCRSDGIVDYLDSVLPILAVVRGNSTVREESVDPMTHKEVTSELPSTLTIAKTIPTRVGGAVIGGDSYLDGSRPFVRACLADDTRERHLDLYEGDVVVFAGTTWQVTRINEPSSAPRGFVATLTRVNPGSPPRSGRFEVDGSLLDLRIAGAGTPPVVCVSALGDDHDEWVEALAQVTMPTTLVTYARPGLGRSDPLPDPRTPMSISDTAQQLRALLDTAGVQSPRILVGHSIGGWIVDRYALLYGDDTAGAVFIDSTDPSMNPLEDEQGGLVDDAPRGIVFDVETSREEQAATPTPAIPHSIVVSSAIGRWHRITDPEPFAPRSLQELDDQWQSHQRQLARRAGAVFVQAHQAGHRIDSEAPGLIARAIDAVVASTTTGAITIDRNALDAAGGHVSDPNRRPHDQF